MNDGNRENRNEKTPPEQERVYAPTHAAGTLNLRPFQKRAAQESGMDTPLESLEEQEPLDPPEPADAPEAAQHLSLIHI